MVKNLSTIKKDWGGKPGGQWEHPSPVKKLMSLKQIMLLVKNFPTQLWKTEEENRTKESINKKPSELDKEIWEKNQKIKNIVNEKTFQPRLMTRKK